MFTGPKGNCTVIYRQCDDDQHRLALPAWEVNPLWKLAMESLQGYDNWATGIVLPIAFQWIEEHKDEVYSTVPEELRDDIGVVISAAFELVRQMPYYRKGVEMGKEFEREEAMGTLDTSKYNPVWTAISTRIQKEVEIAFARHRDVLKHSGEE